jgi:hypothetical protein
MDLNSDITLIFKDKEGNKKELTITVMNMLQTTLEDLHERLEDDCSSSGCNNESQNFCDCGQSYEDYELDDIILEPDPELLNMFGNLVDNVRLNEPEEIILYKKAKALLKQLKTK